jgi:hypothetical protein
VIVADLGYQVGGKMNKRKRTKEGRRGSPPGDNRRAGGASGRGRSPGSHAG